MNARRAGFMLAALFGSSTVVFGAGSLESQAASSCAMVYDDQTGADSKAQITMLGDVTVVRAADDISVDGVVCGTVTTVNVVYFYDNWGGSDQRTTISLAGGPFTPGWDTGATPEINFQYFSTQACDYLRVVGTTDGDHIQWGRTNGLVSANLNADETEDIDSDVAAVSGCVRPQVTAGDGDDLISAQGGLGTGNPSSIGVRFDGGLGDDALTGGGNGDTLIGGPGADTLTGADDPDSLIGGSGADRILGGDGDDLRLLGGAGRDVVIGGAGADKLDGGAGYDVCKGGPGADRFIDCEKVVD